MIERMVRPPDYDLMTHPRIDVTAILGRDAVALPASDGSRIACAKCAAQQGHEYPQ
jgi:hypothetical protein